MLDRMRDKINGSLESLLTKFVTNADEETGLREMRKRVAAGEETLDGGLLRFTGKITNLESSDEEPHIAAEYVIVDPETLAPGRAVAGSTGFMAQFDLVARLAALKASRQPHEQTEKALRAIQEYKPS